MRINAATNKSVDNIYVKANLINPEEQLKAVETFLKKNLNAKRNNVRVLRFA
jgi:hypothetical protein